MALPSYWHKDFLKTNDSMQNVSEVDMVTNTVMMRIIKKYFSIIFFLNIINICFAISFVLNTLYTSVKGYATIVYEYNLKKLV